MVTSVVYSDTTSIEARILEAYKYYYYREEPHREPSYILIGKRAGVPPRMVSDYVRALKEKGIIRVEKPPREKTIDDELF